MFTKMADNFRNKQWFKNMSQERKDEICKKFDIDEKTLRKCGRETDDGRIVINLLKIDHVLNSPESWTEYNNIISENKINLCGDTLESQVENIKYIYSLFHNVKFLKYKNSLHNDTLIKFRVNHINYWISRYNEAANDKNGGIDELEYCAYQIYSHVRSIIETDLNLIKS